MFVLPGLLALVVFIYLRPLDFIPALRGLPLLYIFFGLAVFAFVVDCRQGKISITRPPHGVWVAFFYLWCLFTAAIAAPAELAQSGIQISIAVSIYALMAIGLSSFKAFESLAATILVCAILVSSVCVHQGLQPSQCVAVMPEDGPSSMGHPDGRPCETPETCRIDAPDEDLRYRCEHVGFAGITSIGGGRVRYVGMLQDPNEASMVVTIGVPLAFAFFQRKRTATRFGIAALALLLASGTVVMSKSRGAQLVFLAVLGVYFLKRYRGKGLVVAALVALPVLAMGGRSGDEADESSLERIENLYAGFEMFGRSPIFGVGLSRFTQYHWLTAHNSYVLAPAELGFPGMVAWLAILFVSLKTSYHCAVLVAGPEGEVARTWGLALLASFVGLSVGIFFLSFNYHYIFWIYTGMAGALAAATARHLRSFRMDLSPREIGLVALGGSVLLFMIFVYVKYKSRLL